MAGSFWAHVLVAWWGLLGGLLVLLEASWEAPQVPLGGLWALLGPSGLLQWLSWALLGPSWAALGGS